MEALQEKIKTENKKDDIVKVCFVCSGNTCRSPMAEAVLNYLGKGKYHATSAGLSAFDGMPMSNEAATALEKAGIKTTGFHLSHTLNESDLQNSDIVVAMTGAHAVSILVSFPLFASKITTFSSDVPDPYGQDQEAYDKTLEKIISLIKNKFTLPQGDSNGTQI